MIVLSKAIVMFVFATVKLWTKVILPLKKGLFKGVIVLKIIVKGFSSVTLASNPFNHF